VPSLFLSASFLCLTFAPAQRTYWVHSDWKIGRQNEWSVPGLWFPIGTWANSSP
jgi:hypothetical protein